MDASPSASRLIAWTKFAVFAAAVVGGVAYGAAQMNYAWKWHQVPRFVVRVIDGQIYPGPLLKGLAVTLEISAVSFVVARGLARVYLEVVRNTPLLVQIYLLYFVFAPILGLDRWFAAIFALAVFEGAFAAEIFRGGIQSVPRGQVEAAASLGLGRAQSYRLVIIPQAVRIMLPPLTSLGISLVKHSAIVSAIAMFDLFNEARTLVSDTFLSYEIYLTTGAIYLAVTLTLSLLVTRLERRFARPT
jgi:polar amino acid transport system permease protein